MDSLESVSVESRVYIDEAGIDDNEVYPYAWGEKGKRVYELKNARRKKRLSIISALNNNQLQAPLVFEGTCDRELFEAYLEEVLVPELKTNQTVIMDNASFHKNKKVKEIIEASGCKLMYLPSYSPDLNPIEHHWSKVKTRIRQALAIGESDIYRAASTAFLTSPLNGI